MMLDIVIDSKDWVTRESRTLGNENEAEDDHEVQVEDFDDDNEAVEGENLSNESAWGQQG